MRMRPLHGCTVLLTLLSTACTGTTSPVPQSSPAPASEPRAAGETASAGEMSAEEFEALFRARADSARLRFTEADVRFMTHMIHHHAQALHMAQLADERAGSASVRTLAARIINGQSDEIRTIQNWLRERGQPVPELHTTGDAVMVHGAGTDPVMTSMPGMIDAPRLARLEQARGAEFDRLFLTLMIEHHRGAVSMVRELVATDGALQDEDAFRFAADVQVDQATEVARMERMLSALRSGGSSAGR